MHFVALFNVPSTPIVKEVWSSWGTCNALRLTSYGNLLFPAICWTIWIERNNRIFNCPSLSHLSAICRIDHMLTIGVNAALDAKKVWLDEAIPMIKSSLSFARNSLSTSEALADSRVA